MGKDPESPNVIPHFPGTTMTNINLGQNASGVFLKTSFGYVQVPETCECLGAYFFNEHGEVECNKCHMIYNGV